MRLEQLQEHHVRNKAVLRVASDRLSDVETQQRSERAHRLSGDAESLERLAFESRVRVVDQRVIVERLEAELLRENEAVREVSEDRALGANGAGAHAVHALRAEEAELVFREAIEMRAVEVIHVDAEALERRQEKRLADRSAEARVALLILVVLREIAPRLP